MAKKPIAIHVEDYKFIDSLRSKKSEQEQGRFVSFAEIVHDIVEGLR